MKNLWICAALVVVTTGCDTATRYAAARITWSAAEMADVVASRQYRDLCEPRPTDPERRAECQLAIQRLDQLVALDAGRTRFLSLDRLMRVVRRAASAAVLALWSAEEGEPPTDLVARLSCVAASLAALARGFSDLDVELPVVVEQAITAIVAFGADTRVELLGECPGIDDPPPLSPTPVAEPAATQPEPT